MRAIAEFVMRGRAHAIGIAMISAALPLLNWLGTAVIVLVILRKGIAEGLMVFAWVLLPLGVGYFYIGDSSPVIALTGTVILAYVLRVTMSWEITLAAAVLVSGVGSWIFELTAPEVVAAIVEWYIDYSRQLGAQLKQTVDVSFQDGKDLILGFFALGQAYAMILLLVLGRWWQSQLYNPGGFQKEFHQLRLSPAMSAVIVALMALCFVFNDLLGRWIPLLTVPLVVAALAFVHWAMEYRKLSSNWVFGFYIVLLVMFQLIYPLLASLALMDSWFNLRNRFISKEV